MKKILAVASATLMLSSVAGVSVAHHNDDHDSNYHGMCTAYFSGSEDGQRNKRENGNAFTMFEETVKRAGDGEDYDGDGDFDVFDVIAFCNDEEGGYGNPGQGNEPFIPGDATQSDACNDDPECSYEGGDGTGSGGNGQGNGKVKDGDS